MATTSEQGRITRPEDGFSVETKEDGRVPEQIFLLAFCVLMLGTKKGASATADVLWCFGAKASTDVLGRNPSEVGRHGLDCAGRDFGVVGAGQSRRELDGAAVVTSTGGSVTRLLGQHVKRSRVRRDLKHYFKSGG